MPNDSYNAFNELYVATPPRYQYLDVPALENELSSVPTMFSGDTRLHRTGRAVEPCTGTFGGYIDNVNMFANAVGLALSSTYLVSRYSEPFQLRPHGISCDTVPFTDLLVATPLVTHGQAFDNVPTQDPYQLQTDIYNVASSTDPSAPAIPIIQLPQNNTVAMQATAHRQNASPHKGDTNQNAASLVSSSDRSENARESKRIKRRQSKSMSRTQRRKPEKIDFKIVRHTKLALNRAEMHVFKLQERTRKSMSEAAKRDMLLTRAVGACDYHQKRKEKCDWSKYVRCGTSPNPTFLFELGNIRMFRQRPAIGHPLENHRVELFELRDLKDTVTDYFVSRIQLTQDIGDGLRMPFHPIALSVSIASFTPTEGDKTSHVWFLNGEKKEILIDPYCLAWLGEARNNLDGYIKSTNKELLNDIIKTADPITALVLSEARRIAHQHNSSLLQNTLELLVVCRMIELDWRVCGAETVGLTLVTDPACPWYGKVPIPPVMDTQLDQIIIKDFLTPCRDRVLAELHSKLQAKNPHDLFEIFLTTFILTTHTALLLRHSRLNAQRYNCPRRYNSMNLASEYIHSHNILMTHYHHFARGTALEAKKKASRKRMVSTLPAEQLNFLKDVRTCIAKEDAELQNHRANMMYEKDLYWSHQLFSDTWLEHSTEITSVAS